MTDIFFYSSLTLVSIAPIFIWSTLSTKPASLKYRYLWKVHFHKTFSETTVFAKSFSRHNYYWWRPGGPCKCYSFIKSRLNCYPYWKKWIPKAQGLWRIYLKRGITLSAISWCWSHDNRRKKNIPLFIKYYPWKNNWNKTSARRFWCKPFYAWSFSFTKCVKK